ncbi:molybdopterin-synthase adenylyltransferase MoeB [Verticiella sediminum]|uniref:Molybdopterin-synthase adenylyltransferase n=1 Tax=Verticiella sediminum TaxID=1247510 RepID=A0A556AQ55_9BURK|nr:molybdopterin-synthase adenylyltransferase MoeB [Verticiella sediminum]TSH95039.1 molybdopterin-synthase adenylyltransferase MoeB [Verticiella sediminum]
MNDEQLLRYARHLLLDDIGVEGQERLLASHALIVGAGGLGSPAALYLAAAGVGRITLADDDTVDLTNLQRQIAHTTERVGEAKVASAAASMRALNPDVAIATLAQRLEAASLDAAVAAADVVLDCTDNFATRVAINRACVAHRKPLVSGAAIRFEGQVSVYDPRDAASPCYACLFPETGEDVQEVSCALMGVFSPLVGIVGSMQAAEALKVLARAGTPLVGRLLRIDALHMDWRSVRVRRDPLCAVCGEGRRPRTG